MRIWIQNVSKPSALLLFIFILSLAPVAWADILILKGGGRQEGIVTAAPGDADAVILQKTSGSIKIPRSRIERIEEEDDATDWRRLGDQFFGSRKYPNALEAYRKAARFKPDDLQINALIESTMKALEETAAVERRQQVSVISGKILQAQKEIAAQNFEAAENLLAREIPAMKPTADQQEELVEQQKVLYKAWGKERLDKLEEEQAAKYFERVLGLDPTDKEVYDALIRIWSKNPRKNRQVIRAYEVQLQMKPDDHKARKRLADKYRDQALQVQREMSRAKDDKVLIALDAQVEECYEKAAQHYEYLLKLKAYEPSILKAGLNESLSAIYLRAKFSGDYDRAIVFYKRLRQYDTLPEGEIDYLEFMRDMASIKPTDVTARTSLTIRLQEKGLDSLAEMEVQKLYAEFPTNDGVKKLVLANAENKLAQAKLALTDGKFDVSRQLTYALISEYKEFPQILVKAEALQGQVDTEIQRNRVAMLATAMKYKQNADQYFLQANNYRDNMNSTERNSRTSYVIDKNEAIKYYRLAKSFYDKAMFASKVMDQADRDSIIQRRKETMLMLNKMTRVTTKKQGWSTLGATYY